MSAQWLGLLVLAAAAITAIIGWRMLRGDRENARLAAASDKWPTALGRINSASVLTRVSTRVDKETNQEIESRTYEPKVDYTYSVDARPYSGTRLSFKRPHYWSESKAQAAIANFPAGAEVDVAYDPADPASSVLDRTVKPSAISVWTWFVWGLAAFATAVGIAILVM